MTAKEKVLAVWPRAASFKWGGWREMESGWKIYDGSARDTLLGCGDTEEAAWQNAAESLPAAPEQEKLTDVYEVFGKSARSQGWDFMVCKTLKEALGVIESDLDELDADPDKEDELRIVFRRYTESQMEDVIYE